MPCQATEGIELLGGVAQGWAQGQALAPARHLLREPWRAVVQVTANQCSDALLQGLRLLK